MIARRSAAIAMMFLLPALAGCASDRSEEDLAAFRAEVEAGAWRPESLFADATDRANVTPLNVTWYVEGYPSDMEHLLLDQHAGHLYACVRFFSENERAVFVRYRAELVHWPPDATQGVVVAFIDPGTTSFGPNSGYLALLQHNVDLMEFVEGEGRTRYQLHASYEILLPAVAEWGEAPSDVLRRARPADPPLRGELWYNFTYAPQEEFVEQDPEHCW